MLARPGHVIIRKNDCDNILSGATWEIPPPTRCRLNTTEQTVTLECIYEWPAVRGAAQEQRHLDSTWYINTREHSRLSESYDAGLTHIPVRWIAQRQWGEQVCFHSENHLSAFKYLALPQVVTSHKYFALNISFYIFFSFMRRARLYRNEPFEDWAQRLE